MMDRDGAVPWASPSLLARTNIKRPGLNCFPPSSTVGHYPRAIEPVIIALGRERMEVRMGGSYAIDLSDVLLRWDNHNPPEHISLGRRGLLSFFDATDQRQEGFSDVTVFGLAVRLTQTLYSREPLRLMGNLDSLHVVRCWVEQSDNVQPFSPRESGSDRLPITTTSRCQVLWVLQPERNHQRTDPTILEKYSFALQCAIAVVPPYCLWRTVSH